MQPFAGHAKTLSTRQLSALKELCHLFETRFRKNTVHSVFKSSTFSEQNVVLGDTLNGFQEIVLLSPCDEVQVATWLFAQS